MSVEVKLSKDPELRRYCTHFRLRNTIVDIFVMVLVILSSFTYITSIVKTIKLSKVCIIRMYSYAISMFYAIRILNFVGKLFVVCLRSRFAMA